MSWVVLGAGGFVGSAVSLALTTSGIDHVPVSAPRLTSTATSPAELVNQAALHEEVVMSLADAFQGHTIVVNAAGLATPGNLDTSRLTGANALLPVLVAQACARSGVERLIHLSSAAVQGHRSMLDESFEVEPFSPYSRSKALGEAGLRALVDGAPNIVILRATSVQGWDRPTTKALARLAASPLASVAAPGTAPSPVTSVESLADLVMAVGTHAGPVAPIVLQPWEGLTVRTVLESAGGTPQLLPAGLCRVILKAGYAVSRLTRERLHGSLRRVELMWFGQSQVRGWAEENGIRPKARVSSVLEEAGARRRR
ncbi:NAD(P)-dependent oxidoreductase [Arthrobacter sp. H5]|uniref:NAD-dependent epimerase/dehydratase family protein n=1 Tax=Arthrobacter sp. H5 TaxID=1267973 RepID=UPI000481EEBE|nr:NAD(P)-dependent oxidoreductase [Arthrobacter sp. H5]